MDFEEVLDKTIELLKRRGRITYRMLKRQFGIDDDFIEDLKFELINGERIATDEDGQVLVWTGGETSAPGAPATAAPTAAPPKAALSPNLAHLAPDSAPEPAPERALRVGEQAELSMSQSGERRQLTVMFCDLVGSTQLAERLDPEDLQELVAAYHDTAGAAVRRFDGHIAQYLGDGLLVYFGYPRAHEDDAARAIRAGLDLLEGMAVLNTRHEAEGKPRLSVRVGIHTGLVVVGDMGTGKRQERLALGGAPNVAARVQGEAEPDTIVVSEATHRLVLGLFECDEIGTRDLKGVGEAVELWRVRSVADQSIIELASDSSPLVGRESEVELLVQRWEQVREERGQVVMVTGEAGIGKSRLVEAIRDRVIREGAHRISFRSSPYYTNTPYYAVTERLQREAGFVRDEPPSQRLAKLDAFAHLHGLDRDEAVPLLAELLSVPLEAPFEPLGLSPIQQKRRTESLLTSWLLHEAEAHPVLLLWEDLHWADPSTLDLMGLLIEQCATAPVYALLTFRPDFRAPWPLRSNMAQVILNRFTRTQVELMVERLAGKPLPSEVLEQIIAKTDGVPLFVEEVTKLVLESGLLREGKGGYELTGPLPPLAIPSTLQDSLMARLDRLSTAREVAQLGATVGREFQYDLLAAVAPMGETALEEGLGRLVEAELLYQRGRPPDARYVFKHALIQDLAYRSLLRSTRQHFHSRLVQVLESQFPEVAETRPELLAHHCTGAGDIERAVPYWLDAGRRAVRSSAHEEGIGHLMRGLTALETLPESSERRRLEIRLQNTLGVPLAATRGYGAAEVGQAYARARKLAHVADQVDELFYAVYGLVRYHLLKAEYAKARELGQELLALAERTGDFKIAVGAHRSLGAVNFYMGNLVEARAHLEEVIALDPTPEQRADAFSYDVVDAWVACRSYAAWTLWLLGYADQANAQAQQAIAVSEQLEHPFSLALALSFASWLHQFRGDPARAAECAERSLAISQEHGFEFWVGWDQVLIGWTKGQSADVDTAVGEIRSGLELWRAKGSELGWTYFLALLARTQAAGERFEEGLLSLSEAQSFADQREERFWQAELLRLKGELMLAQREDAEHDAEDCFARALDVARQQQARSLELRAATSLADLMRATGRVDDARDLLKGIHDWFHEGLTSGDLETAGSLLKQLI